MRQVTFYQATKKIVPCFNESTVRVMRMDNIRPVLGSPCEFVERNITEDHHEIHRFVVDSVEVLAAFDQDILMLTGLLNDNIDGRLSSLKSKHNIALEELANTHWLDRIKWLFKPKGVLPNGKCCV